MNSAGTQDFVTPESILLDTAERLGRVRAGRIALHIHMSRLSNTYRDPAYGRIAERMFDNLIANYRCQLFILSNGDIVATGKDMPFGDVDAAVYKLRSLFSADPLVHQDAYGPDDQFCTWYDLEGDFEGFYGMARQAQAAAEREKKNPKTKDKKPTPIQPKELEILLHSLNDSTVRPFISAQAAVNVTPLGESSLAFQEIYVAIGNLAKRIAPGQDLMADRWLFQHFSASLDRRLLNGIDSLTIYGREVPINMNLNISTVLSPTFSQFLNRFKTAKICVEFQPIDVFANPSPFLKACALLHDLGHNTLIDGLSPLSLWMLADAGLPVDKYKLMWTTDLQSDHRGAADRDPRTAIQVIGPQNIVLGHCDSFAALDWGLKNGIRTFQGYFVDDSLLGQAGGSK